MEQNQFNDEQLAQAQTFTDACYNFGGTVLAACNNDFERATKLLKEYAEKLADEPGFIDFLENFKGLEGLEGLDIASIFG